MVDVLWGPGKGLDFWTARARGLVHAEEERAVTLLARICDERRFSFYCLSGMLPAMGNVTRRTYLVRRFTTVLELDAGLPVAAWCIVTRDRGWIPETDHVVTLKNLLEGEELAFRATGNRFPQYDPSNGRAGLPGFPNAYVAPFAPREGSMRWDDWTDYRGTESALAVARARQKTSWECAFRASQRAIPRTKRPEDPAPSEPQFTPEARAALDGILTGLVGYVRAEAERRVPVIRADGSLFN